MPVSCKAIKVNLHHGLLKTS